MKPGDLVTIRRWNLTHRTPIAYVSVYDRTSQGEYMQRKAKWEHGDIGIRMAGIDVVEDMVQVLLQGRVVWVDEEMLRPADGQVDPCPGR